jgi:coenzyme Q-binding protein COQ10
MPRIQRSAHVPYTASQMFDLVDDIERYPEFLTWCCGARVTQRDSQVVEATLDVGIAGFSLSFSTRNLLSRPRRIDIGLSSGPFRSLEGRWTFDDQDEGCDIQLSLEFEVRASPLSAVLSGLFEEIGKSQMNAFLDRAAKIYG